MRKLVEKGILTQQEAKELAVESVETNQIHHLPALKWRINDAFKSIELFGDVRLRYEYRAADDVPGSGSAEDTYMRDRFRYAVRIGVRGDLFDDFYYGLRIETSTNPRSTWVTFGDDSNPTPSAKNSDGVNIGQAYVGWRPTKWYEMTVGKMPMPLYVTPMIWDSDINPEGAVEKFKYDLGPVSLFANFGQFLYQDTNPDVATPSSDTFLLTWQLGAGAKVREGMSVKVAPVIYNYTGTGSKNGLNKSYTGEGLAGLNPNNTPALNQNGINDLLVLEVPAELNVKVGRYNARAFGDFAYNFYGEDRAKAAFAATQGSPVALSRAYTDENKAYQFGLAFGNFGKGGDHPFKHTWDVRAYWQHVEQYAADVNLLDSDLFEGRANLEGVATAIEYGITDNPFGTFRYAYATRINENLGTGGSNPDMPILNPVRNYHLLQLDLTLKF